VLGSREFVESQMKAWMRATGRKFAPKIRSIQTTDASQEVAVIKRLRGSAFS